MEKLELAKGYEAKEIEGKWYQYWLDNSYFRSVPDEREPYTVVIPPPNVTGVLHMGHMLNNTIQDVLVRRARMQGKNACAGCAAMFSNTVQNLANGTGWFSPAVPLQCDPMNPDQYCQEKCAASGSSFYYSFLFLPVERRRAIMALYAFCREGDDVVDECHDHEIDAGERDRHVWRFPKVRPAGAGLRQHRHGADFQQDSARRQSS